jgi:hypothetical protein
LIRLRRGSDMTIYVSISLLFQVFLYNFFHSQLVDQTFFMAYPILRTLRLYSRFISQHLRQET